MPKIEQFIFCSTNKGKIRELTAIGDRLRVKVVGIESIISADKLPEVEENGETYEENAAIKVLAFSDFLKANGIDLTGSLVLADDAGLEVESLQGRPGVYSARYAGKGATADQNNQKLLQELGDSTNRSARLISVLACLKGSPNGGSDSANSIIYSRGELRGSITAEPDSGSAGFGYDSVFKPEKESATLSRIKTVTPTFPSHRYLSFKVLLRKLR